MCFIINFTIYSNIQPDAVLRPQVRRFAATGVCQDISKKKTHVKETVAVHPLFHVLANKFCINLTYPYLVLFSTLLIFMSSWSRFFKYIALVICNKNFSGLCKYKLIPVTNFSQKAGRSIKFECGCVYIHLARSDH